MRTSFRPAAVTLVVAIGLTASGCATDDPAPKPSTSTSAAPLFASDEEALAAAEEAYAAYQAVSDAILMDGGSNPERLLLVATNEQYEAEKTGIREIAQKGYRSVGATKFDSMKLQNRDQFSSPDQPFISAYVCDDYTEVDIVDALGNSVVASDRRDRFPRVISFSKAQSGQSVVTVAAIDEWTGEDFC